jgi:hypothetical protein
MTFIKINEDIINLKAIMEIEKDQTLEEKNKYSKVQGNLY